MRIAAIEDYLARATALPFVADDLFINFDPDRSAAGFDILGQLAEKTQVLFFTHHLHLVDIAQNRLGSNTHVLTLEKMMYGHPKKVQHRGNLQPQVVDRRPGPFGPGHPDFLGSR